MTLKTMDLHKEIAARHDDRERGKERDLERYYRVLRDELTGIELSDPEARLLVESMSMVPHIPDLREILWPTIGAGEEQRGLAVKHKVDEKALEKKLEALTPGQSEALIDAVHRYLRHGQPDTRGASMMDTLRLVGFAGEAEPIDDGSAKGRFVARAEKLIAGSLRVVQEAHGEMLPGSMAKRVACQLWADRAVVRELLEEPRIEDE